jgi:hypothetical protein
MLQRTGGVDPEEQESLADVLMPGDASRAFATGEEGANHHLLSWFELVDTRTDLDHAARHLVPDQLREGHPVVHGPVDDVEIRATDPDIGDLDHQLPLAGGHWWRHIDSHLAIACVEAAAISHRYEFAMEVVGSPIRQGTVTVNESAHFACGFGP